MTLPIQYYGQNFGQGFLGVAMGLSDITMTMNVGHDLPTNVGDIFIIVVWDSVSYPNPANDPNVEIIQAIYSGTINIYNVTRALEGTVSSTHNVGAKVSMNYTAGVRSADFYTIGSKVVDETTIGNNLVLGYNSSTNTLRYVVGGASGYSGYSGISGYSGNNPGTSGYSGFSGYSGQNPGASGYSGYSGRSGYSGISGFSGQNPGISGYSGISGAMGYSGYSGISGYSGAPLPSQTGNSGYFLKTNGSTTSWTQPAFTYASGLTYLIYSNNAIQSTTNTTYTLVKETYFPNFGSVTVQYTAEGTSGDSLAYAQTWVNGTAVGTENNLQNTVYNTYTDVLTGLIPGDFLQVYAHSSGGQTVNVKNFQIFASNSGEFISVL